MNAYIIIQGAYSLIVTRTRMNTCTRLAVYGDADGYHECDGEEEGV